MKNCRKNTVTTSYLITLAAGTATSFCILLCDPVYAFNSLTHSQVTHSAYQYLDSEVIPPASLSRWFREGPSEGRALMRQQLVRSIVDADYKSDLWLTGAFHQPVAGGIGASGLTLFTTLFHHINVTVPGTYWDDDGYAYRHTTGTGNDSLLNTFSAQIVGAVSPALGGYNAEHPAHAFALPAYNEGFKGSLADWNYFFFGANDPTQAVFPPASVPASLAYNLMLSSDRARTTFVDSWSERLPLISGAVSEETKTRFYWRSEIKGLPRAFDMLGLVLHMAQDMGMPHHTQGTASFCHPEMEGYLDQLACGSVPLVPLAEYDKGNYREDFNRCQKLYDPHLVSHLLSTLDPLQLSRSLSIKERLRAIAVISSRWRWGASPLNKNFILSVFPDGTRMTHSSCSGFIGKVAVQNQLKYQYNLAVASTVAILKLAARDYESVEHKVASPKLGQGLPFYMTPAAALAPPAPFLNRDGTRRPASF